MRSLVLGRVPCRSLQATLACVTIEFICSKSRSLPDRMLPPMPRSALAALLSVLVVLGATEAFAASDPDRPVPLDDPRTAPTTMPSAEQLMDGVGRIEALLGKARYDRTRGVYVSPLGRGTEAELTLDPGLQQAMERLLRNYNVPYGAVVALDPRTGRILAMAEHSEKDSSVGLATRALYPAASVFKIVTGAALLEAGVKADTEVCYHGGLRGLQAGHLKDDPKRDHSCASLARAMGHSLNVVMAKLANRNLSVDELRSVAGRFLFNEPLPVKPAPPSVGEALISPALIPEDELGFGRTAAGFGRVFLSPLHGAMMIGAIGNAGVAFEPELVDAVVENGERKPTVAPLTRRLVTEENATVLTEMLELTVSEGTARKSFLERGRSVLGGVKVAGKTGSLADRNPYKDYSWFVGFAPAESPRIAVAVVIVNELKWRIKSSYVAREAIRKFLNDEANNARAATRAATSP